MVVANWRYRTGGNNRQDGAVFAYRGVPPAGYSLGGLANEPSWGVIASGEDDDDREFARFLKVSDIDQDGRSDLLVGHWYDAPLDRQGSMKIFLGRNFNTTPEIISADQFDWRIQGESDFDYLGIYGDVMDVNADGLPDILIGATQGGERATGSSNQRVGHVGVYLGQPNDVPEVAPHTQSHGEISGDWWGHGVTAFMRPHPQETVTGLVVFSSRKDKNEAAKLPHLALTELVAPTAGPIDAGTPQPSTCEVVAQIETSVVYPTKQPTLAVQISVPVFESTDAGDGGTVFDSGSSLDFRPLTQVRFTSARQPDIADPAAAWLDAVFAHEADGSWVFARDVPTPSFGQKILVARTLGPTGAWVYCDGDATNAIFSLDESPRQDIRLELNIPSEYGGSQFGQSAAFVPHFFGVDVHALAVGANRAANGTQQSQSGTVKIYANAAGGFSRTSHLTLAEHQGHNGYDVFGSAMHSAGYFFDTQTPALAVISEYDDLPRSNARNGWAVDDNCPASNNRDNAGSLNIFQGGALTQEEQQNGVPRRDPTAIIFGPQASQRLQDVAGELDVNGDGLEDLIVTSRFLDSGNEPNNICPGDNCGGYRIVLGHPKSGSEVAVNCDSDSWFFGRENGAELGHSVAALGDLNADGCDDFAVGAPLADYGVSNQGAVHVIFGNDGAGCPEDPLEVILVPNANGARFGYALDGRVDLTGDTIPDLLVGAPRGRDGEEVVGAAYLVSGAYLASLFPQATPANQSQNLNYFALGDATHTFSRLLGHGSGNEFGYAVAMVPSGGDHGAAAIAVGEPYSSSFGFDRTGAVWGYRYDTTQQAFSPIPIFGVAGESDRPDSRLGITVSASQLGGTTFLSVGGDLMSTYELDQGACFVWPFNNANQP